jgi:lysine 2,3-aminomutase
MYSNSYTIEASNEMITASIRLKTLVCGMIDFLEHFEWAPLVGKEFHSLFNENGDTEQTDGVKKLFQLLEVTGHPYDPEGFFNKLIDQLSKPGREKITLNNIVMPHLLLVSVLEKIMPGNGLIFIKDTDTLAKVTNSIISENKRKALQKVLDTYPVRLSMHTIRQAAVSEHIAKQYMPFVNELDDDGRSEIWVGQFQKGIIEQMYNNRVIFLLNMNCPVYCRFCFRKHKDSRKAPNSSTSDVKNAIEHVEKSPSIKEILITGGDPFLSRKNMEVAIEGLIKVPHVQTIRLATRSISYYPHLFLENDSDYLKYLQSKNIRFQKNGKRMEIATHFIHPDEISPQSLDIISQLSKSGINVYVQTPVLKDCNDKGPELASLFRLLRGAGAELHYIFTPCSPIHGNSTYRTSISNGISIAKYLRAHLSDRGIPKITTATSIGKVEWHTSGWAVEQDKNDENFIWIRTSFTLDYFKAFTSLSVECENTRVNMEGTIDIRFMAGIGDEALFIGPRQPRESFYENNNRSKKLENVASVLKGRRSIQNSIVQTGCKHLSRSHETKVEIDTEAGKKDFDYIQKDERITDVVILFKQDDTRYLLKLNNIIKTLYTFPHVNAVRLCNVEHLYTPSVYTPDVIHELGRLNRLTVVNPQKIEIETRFLVADEIKPEHEKLTRSFNNKGIAVYNNTPLLGGINDSPCDIQKLAFALRQIGIEFHHLYVAGLAIQNKWNTHHPVDMYDIIDIAARIRREGSGREIPRYIIHTPLGDADYGLTSSLINNNGQLSVKLTCYDKAYFKNMDPGFFWPENVVEDKNGKPIIPLAGLTQSTDFPI